MSNTEKQFEDLLKTADQVAELYDKEELSDEDIEDIFNLMNQGEQDPSQLFPSNNGHEINENTDPANNVKAKVLVSANPTTGLLNTIPYNDENITEESLDKFLELKDEDLKRIEINEGVFNENVKAMYPEITGDDLKNLLDVVNKYREGRITSSYFNNLPECIKKEINEYVNAGAIQHQMSKNSINQMKNMLAKELFDTVITQNFSSKAFADISKVTMNEINKEKEKLGGSLGDYNIKLREEYETGFIKKAELLEKEGTPEALETAEKFRKGSAMFIQSYTYEDMYEAYKNGKIKVKNIQMDKFNRTCSEFNRKYYNNTLTVNDVGMTVPVLDRVLDKKYDINTIKKFIVIFINYTKNYKPANIDEHIFMYYFIKHILTLDIKIPGNDYENFNDLLKENIYKFLDLIVERDAAKEELKKGMKK